MYKCGDVILDTDGQQITHTLWGTRKTALLLGGGSLATSEALAYIHR